MAPMPCSNQLRLVTINIITDDHDANAIVHRTSKQGDRQRCILTCRASADLAAREGLRRQQLHSSWAGILVCQPEPQAGRLGLVLAGPMLQVSHISGCLGSLSLSQSHPRPGAVLVTVPSGTGRPITNTGGRVSSMASQAGEIPREQPNQ